MYYKNTSSSTWTTLQSYSVSDTVTLTPPESGTYEICVKVKDSSGTVAKKYFVLTVEEQ